MSFTKVGGTSYFYPNRTPKSPVSLEPFQINSHGLYFYYTQYFGQAQVATGTFPIYNDQKTDIAIIPTTDLDETGGYLVTSSGKLLVYESIDKAVTVNTYDSSALRAQITIEFNRLTPILNTDTMTIDGIQYTFDTSSISQSAGTVIAIGDGQGNGSSDLATQIFYIVQFINSYINGWEAQRSTSDRLTLSIRTTTNDNSKDSSEFRLDTATLHTFILGTETGTVGTFNPRPWTRPWLLKNCFIPAEKIMYGANAVVGSSVSLTQHNIGSGNLLYKPQYSLQLMNDPVQPYGVYWKNGGDVNAKIRFEEADSNYSQSYFELELLAASGAAGNTYSFEIREHPDKNNGSTDEVAPYVVLENSGQRIVLYFGKNSNGTDITVGSWERFEQAFIRSGLDIDNYVRLIAYNDIFSLTSVLSETFFSGGITSASNLIEEGAVEWTYYTILKSLYSSSYNLAGEKDSFGRDRIINDDSLTPALGDGKHSGIFFGVVPAGNSLPARQIISFIEYEAVTAGTAGNNLTIQYTSGATAGSEVVSEVGNDITIQIEDGVSTRQQIVDAVTAQATLIKARIFGVASDAQTVGLTPSPVNLEDGRAALAADSGFFMTEHHRPNNSSLTGVGSSRNKHLYFFTDINDPDSFSFVREFGASSRSSSAVFNQIEFSRRYEADGAYLRLKMGGTVYDLKAQPAGITYTTNTRFQLKDKTFGGNYSYRIEFVRDVAIGGEFVELNGDLFTFHINTSNSTTVADLQAAIVTAGLDNLIEIDAANTSTAINSAKSPVTLRNAVEPWTYEGKTGFGYVTINRVLYTSSRADGIDNTTYLGPISRENYMSMVTFRTIDFNGVG